MAVLHGCPYVNDITRAWPYATVSPGLMQKYRPCLALCNGIARAWPYATVSPVPGQLSPMPRLTDAGGGEEPDALVRRLTLREEELDGVLGEGERHNRHGAGADDEALRPQPHEAHEGAERVQDVSVVTARLPVPNTESTTWGKYGRHMPRYIFQSVEGLYCKRPIQCLPSSEY
jgi:hypothetical protein